MQDPICIRLENLEDKTKRLEDEAKSFGIAIAEIKVMIHEIQKDISEIKSTLNTKKNNHNQVELKRYEYLLMLGTIIISLISFFTVIVKGGLK